jgi:L-ribulokinase
VEHADWIPAVLTGTDHPSKLKRCRCAAGHKAMFNEAWRLSGQAFMTKLDPKLGRVRDALPNGVYGGYCRRRFDGAWAAKLGLPAGIPVAIGAFDAHLGGVGSGIGRGRWLKSSVPAPAIWASRQAPKSSKIFRHLRL